MFVFGGFMPMYDSVSVIPHVPTYHPILENEFLDPSSGTSSALYLEEIILLYSFPVPVYTSFNERPCPDLALFGYCLL